ncbi:hypothetical protein EZV62_000032 [Acer yangbiense]|uniref:Pectinesterase inhibitor domain-containing protein n=1 Tax=Acer yangbiense TaxID=1000413 RepID=A0A5C7IPZ7_9ROSI|nr:hypothetical protein EZV62_000032 [Acer yangbiense]
MVSFKSYFFRVSILGVLLFITPSNASSKIVNDICAKTRFPSICLEILESTPGAAAADVKGLGKITLDLARSSASKTLGQINSLIPKTIDPKLKEIYKTCSEHYDNAIGSFNNAETDLNNSNYFSMNSQASAAMTEAGDCDDETAKLAVDPSVKKGNLDLDHICVILFMTPSSNAKASSKFINDICAKTRVPSYCLELLESTPGAAAALKALAKSPSTWHYDDAIDDLKDSETTYFNEGDFDGMNTKASAAMTEAGDCDDETAKHAVDPSIKKGNLDLDHTCSIILVISNNL